MRRAVPIGISLLLAVSAAGGFESVRSSMPTNRVSLLVEWVSDSRTETNDTRLIDVFFTPSVFISVKKGVGHSSVYESTIVEFSETDKNQAIEHLLSAGANPNESLNSMTVLDWAIQLRNKKIIWLLLGNKWAAKLSLPTLETAYQTAREKDDDLICLRIHQLMDDIKQKTAPE